MPRPHPIFTIASLSAGLVGTALIGACVHGQANLREECPASTESCEDACVDTSRDTDHCGACGTACLDNEACLDGSCVAGCDDGQTPCGDECVNTDNDPDHCGDCDEACDSGEVCGQAECLTSCPAGTTECSGSCIDTESDSAHCGGCNLPCESGESCTGGQCHAESCRVLLEADPSLTDGLYTVDPDGSGGEAPFEVACDMSTDGGGWLQLQLDDSDSVLMAQNSAGNPWTKCEDDSAKHYAWIAEADVVADFEGSIDQEIDLGYLNPLTATPYAAAQLTAIRSAISELSVTTRMVANTADDDGGDWQTTMMTGHEVYIMGASMTWTLLTPGEDGECGGSTGFPLAGTSAGHYLWHTGAASSEVDGTTGLTNAELTGLSIGDILPLKARLVVQTGGGVSFGWEKEILLVR